MRHRLRGYGGTLRIDLPSSKPICCSFIVQNEGTLVVANSTRSCDSIDFRQAIKYQFWLASGWMKISRSIKVGIWLLVGCYCLLTMTRVRLLELKWYILAMFNVIFILFTRYKRALLIVKINHFNSVWNLWLFDFEMMIRFSLWESLILLTLTLNMEWE